MIETPPATLRLRVDTGALGHNWRALDRLSGSASAGAAIKSNCYGLGIEKCLPVLRDAGCKAFYVAHWSEVAGAANHVPAEQIAVLHGPITDTEARYALETGAVPVINTLEQARRWNEAGGGRCHLMIDSGINRLGISLHEVGDPAIAALEVDVIMSHLACADEDSAMNARQLARFRKVLPLITHRAESLANSAGIALGSDYHFDLTRPGLALYGGVPRSELAGTIRQVAFPEVSVIQRRSIEAGETVGYSATWTAKQRTEIAVASLGYADGFLRAWHDGEPHLLRGETRLPIIGKISMDMIVLDCSAMPDLREGDWLSVPYWLPNAAQRSGLSQYELLTILGRRFDG
ncbi:alanine racemase [Qipengyuania atrilutea]|uniref:alanine racemase n=1 Tax=Qipengyuania atrilutea TaxID=2744473 RepID=A0A850GZZ1_9SPHN|nr:alanine racemase [Actirhodobacter atriluteus]NVD43810.1 alanine racemase [Actirhodobacter atriluteus]